MPPGGADAQPTYTGSGALSLQDFGVSNVTPDQLQNFSHANRAQYYTDSQGNQYNSDGQIVLINRPNGQYSVDPNTGTISNYIAPSHNDGFFGGILNSIGNVLSNPVVDAIGIGLLTGGLGDLGILGSLGGAGLDAGAMTAADYAASTAATQAALADAGFSTGLDAATAAGAGAGAGAAAASTAPTSSVLDSLNLMPSNQALTNAAIKTGLGLAQGQDPTQALESGALGLVGGVVGGNVANLVNPVVSDIVDNSAAANAISQGVGSTAGSLATGNTLPNALIGGVGTGVSTELGPNGTGTLSAPLANMAGSTTSALLSGASPATAITNGLIGAGGSLVGSAIGNAINGSSAPTPTDMSGFYTPTDTTSFANYQANQPTPDTTGLGSGNYNTDTTNTLDFLNNGTAAPAPAAPSGINTSQLADGSWKYEYPNGTWAVTDQAGNVLYDSNSQPTDASTVAPPSESSYTPSGNLENVDVSSTSTSGQDTVAPPGEASYTPPASGLPNVTVTGAAATNQDPAASPDDTGLQTITVTGQNDSSVIQPTPPETQPINPLPSDFLSNIDTTEPLQTVEIVGDKPTDTTIQPTEPTGGDITPVNLPVTVPDTTTTGGGGGGGGSTKSTPVTVTAPKTTVSANGYKDPVLDFTPHTSKGSQITLVGTPHFSESMINPNQTYEQPLPEFLAAKAGGSISHFDAGGSTGISGVPTSGVTKGSNITLVGTPSFSNTMISPQQYDVQPLPQFQYAMGGAVGYADGGSPVNLQPQVTHGHPQYLQNFISNIPQTVVGMIPFQHHKTGHSVVDEHRPEFFSEGGLNSIKHTYVTGQGDGTSDSIPAMLANGEFVIPADVVSGLGNGSNDAGAKVLDEFMKTIRQHKQSHGHDGLPPDSKGALSYLQEATKKVK